MKTNHTTSIPRLTVDQPDDEREIAKRVGAEILERRFSPAEWAEALLAAATNETEATVEYARIRTSQLQRERVRRELKAQRLEQRRLRTGSGVKSVKDLLRRGGVPGNRALTNRPSLSVMWLVSLLFGSVGAAGCGMRLFESAADGASVALPAFVCGVGIVAITIGLWRLLPRSWVQLGYRTCLGGITAVACLSSFYLATKLLAQAPQHWHLIGHRIVAVSGGTSGDKGVSAPVDDRIVYTENAAAREGE